MMTNTAFRSPRARRFAAIGSVLLASACWSSLARAQDAAADEADEIIVTGYRASLQQSTDAKRESIGFTDSIFAEDIGKFPDTNIAESLNRIPGITISREITGEGLNIAIRGLGTNFTRVLLNNAPVAIASTGRTDGQNTNREVDLDLMPTELFTQLTVSKSPTAGMIEGGAAGTVNLRSARPFDGGSGLRVNYGAQLTKGSNAGGWGYRGHVMAAWHNDTFGVLVGAAGVRNKIAINGFETIGWTNPNLSATQSTSATRNATGGGNWTIPGTVPANAGNGLVTGATIDQAFLLANNPGTTIDQIDNGLIPRLGRPMQEFGKKDRYNFIGSLEFRPSDALHFYVDSMYGRKQNDMDRIDMNWVGRNGAMIPINTKYDRTDCTAGCVVTQGTYANAQYFLEFRPYNEDVKFWGVNPGVDFVVNDWISGDIQANYTKSDFRRDSPTVLVITPASSGITINYTNDGTVPKISSTVDLNNPANFGWAGGRVNIQSELRETRTKGVRGNLHFGKDDGIKVSVGAAYDDTSRRVRALDNSQAWQNAVCGSNPSVFLPGPNRQPPCQGLALTGSAATVNAGNSSYPAWAGYGSGFSAGQTGPITYAGSLIPQTALAGFLKPSPYGFITVDWDKFRTASRYDQFLASAPEGTSSNTGANGGYVREKVFGAYIEANGKQEFGDNTIRLNAGLRYARTDQTIGGFVSIADPRNAYPDPDGTGPLLAPPACPGNAGNGFATDGSCYPNRLTFANTNRKYENWLPSVSAVAEFGRSVVVRGSVSRTMTRPNPNAMLPGLNFSSPSADTGSLGNNALAPFISNNIDLGVEWYTGGEGVIALAAFTKSIKGFTVNGNVTMPFSALAAYGVTFDTLNPTQQAAITSRGGPGAAQVTLTQQVNADGKLKVDGIEAQLVQPLDFITRNIGVTGFGIQANYTRIWQSGSGGGAPAIAVGVAPETYVLTGYYDKGGISARLAYTYNAGSQQSLGGQNGISAAALWGNSYDQLDFSGSVDLAKVLGNSMLPQLTVDVVNITKSKQRSYFQFENAAFTYYDPGRVIMLGVRGKF